MTAQEQLKRLHEERKLLVKKLAALDQQIRAQEQQVAAEAPEGWVAIIESGETEFQILPLKKSVSAHAGQIMIFWQSATNWWDAYDEYDQTSLTKGQWSWLEGFYLQAFSSEAAAREAAAAKLAEMND